MPVLDATRIPETATLIKIRVFFAGYPTIFRVFTLGEPTRAPNSRVYEVGGLYSKVSKVRGYANLCSMEATAAIASRLPIARCRPRRGYKRGRAGALLQHAQKRGLRLGRRKRRQLTRTTLIP